jgi:hypothetical protein
VDRDKFVNSLFLHSRVRLVRIQARWTYDAAWIAARLSDVGLAVSPCSQLKCTRPTGRSAEGPLSFPPRSSPASTSRKR